MEQYKFDISLSLSLVDAELHSSDPESQSQPQSFQVNILSLKQLSNNFLIKTQDKQWVSLREGDFIILSNVHLKVTIIKRKIIENPDPSVHQNDLFCSENIDVWEGNSWLPPEPQLKQNPHNNTLIPHSSGISTLHYDAIPMLNSPMPAMPMMSDVGERSPDVTKVLADKSENKTNQAYSEQAPVDMLDEFLQDDIFEERGNCLSSIEDHGSYSPIRPSYLCNRPRKLFRFLADYF